MVPILFMLKNELTLSSDEFRTLLYLACELEKYDIHEAIRKLRDSGIGFYKKSKQNLYFPDSDRKTIGKIKKKADVFRCFVR